MVGFYNYTFIVSFLNLNLAAEILPNPIIILREDFTDETVLNILEVKINPSTFNDATVQTLSTSTTINNTPLNSKSESVYVNSDVSNSYLKVFVTKVHLLECGIRLSLKVLWNILKDDKPTEDWIGYYLTGSYEKKWGLKNIFPKNNSFL